MLKKYTWLLFGLGVVLNVVGRLIDITAMVGSPETLSARLFRLGSVASMALPILTLALLSLPTLTADLGLQRRAGLLAALGASLMAPVLLAASFVHPAIKYLLPIPATATTLAVTAAVVLAFRAQRFVEATTWGVLLASLSGGLLLGLFAFDGPMPTPTFIGGYGDPIRTVLRAAHIVTAAGTLAVLASMRLLAVARPLRRSAHTPPPREQTPTHVSWLRGMATDGKPVENG